MIGIDSNPDKFALGEELKGSLVCVCVSVTFSWRIQWGKCAAALEVRKMARSEKNGQIETNPQSAPKQYQDNKQSCEGMGWLGGVG